jgi:phosphatidylinositol 4-kinase type 2
MQFFLHGFQGISYIFPNSCPTHPIIDASDFLRKHPWPGRAISDTFDDSSHRRGHVSRRFLNTFKIVCGRTGDAEDSHDDSDYDEERVLYDASESNNSERPFYWSQTLQKSFREELEKWVLVPIFYLRIFNDFLLDLLSWVTISQSTL